MADHQHAILDSAETYRRARRELIRWLCLQCLDHYRPDSTQDLALLAAINEVHKDADRKELRRELDYLRLRGLVTVADCSGDWTLTLTFQGVDFVEYTSSDLPGIGRPRK